VARRPKPKFQTLHARRKKSGGGFGALLVLVMVAVVAWFWWRHEHPPNKIVPPSTTVAKIKPPPKPLIVERQSPADFPRPAHDVLEMQVALARRGISPGSIDAALGSQTRMAISVFQQTEGLPQTGKLDSKTGDKLALDSPILTNYVVMTNDLARLQPLGKTWLEKSQQSALDYETELELVAEKSHAHPELIRRLNPNVNWTNIVAGTFLQILEVNYTEPSGKAAFVVIHLSEKFLEAFDENSNLLAHFPCSIAARFDKRPVGELHVVVVAPNPNYTFDPELFPESSETQKLVLPPGPNNPVGVAWIGLDKTGYGIHGTPAPEQVGRTESHGCFRLANWDAEYLLKLAWVGMPVEVEP
jgi:lipoprotein-anchoring transpeptidase ErfK/SrfK